MKFAVFGATGQTGLHVVKQALEAGHDVTALVRNPDKLTFKDDKLTIESINIFDKESFSSKLAEHDVVFSCLGFQPDKAGVTGYTKATEDLDYTVVRPPGLTNSALANGEIKTTVDGFHVPGASGRVPRANVAKFMLECVNKDEFKGKGVAIGM